MHIFFPIFQQFTGPDAVKCSSRCHPNLAFSSFDSYLVKMVAVHWSRWWATLQLLPFEPYLQSFCQLAGRQL